MTAKDDTAVEREDIEEARRRLAKAMACLSVDMDGGDRARLELQLQHAHARLGGEKEHLYSLTNDEV